MTTGTMLQIRRTFRAPRERVWAAFTDPAQLQRWYALEDDWATPVVEIDLRVGGRYRIGLQPPGRPVFYETGTYVEIAEPGRLVYTCVQSSEGGVGHDETLVTIDFVELDGDTEVVLTQGYHTVADRDLHGAGWQRFLDRLERALD